MRDQPPNTDPDSQEYKDWVAAMELRRQKKEQQQGG
jgi:hypothetical protein